VICFQQLYNFFSGMKWRKWHVIIFIYESVSKSFRTGRLEQELQMAQLSTTRYSCIAILWVSLVLSFAAIALCVASQRVFIVVSFIIDSVRKLLDTPSYCLELVAIFESPWVLAVNVTEHVIFF